MPDDRSVSHSQPVTPQEGAVLKDAPSGPPNIGAVDPEVLARETAFLTEVSSRPLFGRMAGYLKLSGPGWMQSAFTLGGGTLASSLILGSLVGYKLLWIQPAAMICGAIMLSALAYQTLSTNVRPLEAVKLYVHPLMAYGWALASLLASIIWCLPQYSLSTSVISDISGVDFSGGMSLIPSLIILGCLTTVTWNYGSSKGIRLYELVIKLFVAAVVICFGLVAMKTGVQWAALADGFFGFHIPYPGYNYEAWAPAAQKLAAEAAAAGKPDPQLMNYIGSAGWDTTIAACATAVGINMTFLFPYSLRARGWGKAHRGLAQFDLWTGLLIPFVIATSLVVIAAANQLHGDSALVKMSEHGPEIKAGASNLAGALEPVAGKFFAHTIFGAGVLGMTLSTITLLMLVSGFIVMELTGSPVNGTWYKFGTMLPALGILGPLVWSKYGFYMAVPTSIINFTFLPIAYISFFVLMNSKAYLGDARPEGGRRVAWNLAMGISILLVTVGAVRSIYLKLQELL